MKKLLSLLLVAVLALSMAACGGTTTPDTDESGDDVTRIALLIPHRGDQSYMDVTAHGEVLVEEKYGAIVVATGFNPISMDKFDEFAYSKSPDVVTSLEYERLMNAAGPTGGTLLRPSDGEHPHTIVFVQCVGSRCDDSKGKPYCSKICCMYTAKHAMLTREKYQCQHTYTSSNIIQNK